MVYAAPVQICSLKPYYIHCIYFDYCFGTLSLLSGRLLLEVAARGGDFVDTTDSVTSSLVAVRSTINEEEQVVVEERG